MKDIMSELHRLPENAKSKKIAYWFHRTYDSQICQNACSRTAC